LDGTAVTAEDVVGRLNTFPLFPGSKVVTVHDARVFYSKAGVEELAKKSIAAFDKQDLETASRHFVNMLSLGGISFDELKQHGIEGLIKSGVTDRLDVDKDKQAVWVNQLVDFCESREMAVPTDTGADQVMDKAIVSGFPERNHLVLVTDFVDKRKRIYKTIKRLGVVVDCSVPQGSNRSNEQERLTLLRGHARDVMAGAGKKGAPGLVEALYEKTGASLRSFDSELRKLIDFVGQRERLELDDVASALEKSKQDPIYELGNAVAEKDVSKALYYLDNLLIWDFHPLQILSAIVNQFRKLVLGKEMIDVLMGGRWDDRLDFPGFQRTVWPKAKAVDDGVHVKNMHPYVLYKTLMRAGNYRYGQLEKAVESLWDADRALKSAGKRSRLILEKAIMETCGT
jgi:DNA polymerase-3 subunit delta